VYGPAARTTRRLDHGRIPAAPQRGRDP